MIDVVVDKERNLKNLKQIGTPQEENKIYVENLAYSKLKEDSYKEKKVFVLMGHTERMNGRYATFVEAVIPVNEMEFSGSIPKWNNKTWGIVFREIKRIYEDMIIVGWALDAKGMGLKLSPELERIHREHFGGVHQLLFLMDSMEKEETFYTYKENRLCPKDGFFIYYHSKTSKVTEDVTLQIPERKIRELSENYLEKETEQMHNRSQRGQYRELLLNQEVQKNTEGSNMGIAVAVALLAIVLGIGAYENRDSIFGKTDIPTVHETGNISTEGTEANTSWGTETESETEGATETGNTIPIEIIPGDEEKNSE